MSGNSRLTRILINGDNGESQATFTVRTSDTAQLWGVNVSGEATVTISHYNHELDVSEPTLPALGLGASASRVELKPGVYQAVLSPSAAGRYVFLDE